MDTLVNICFEIPDTHECDQVFHWMRDNPKDIWSFEKRVQKGLHTADLAQTFALDARWSDEDILETRLTRLQFYEQDSNIIQYEATIKRSASDPRVLVDLIRRCKVFREGAFGGWTVRAWYRGDADSWSADAGNGGQPYYNLYGGFNENVLCPWLDRVPVAPSRYRTGNVAGLLRRLQQVMR